jgi:prephenate dehydrogenase
MLCAYVIRYTCDMQHRTVVCLPERKRFCPAGSITDLAYDKQQVVDVLESAGGSSKHCAGYHPLMHVCSMWCECT